MKISTISTREKISFTIFILLDFENYVSRFMFFFIEKLLSIVIETSDINNFLINNFSNYISNQFITTSLFITMFDENNFENINFFE